MMGVKGRGGGGGGGGMMGGWEGTARERLLDLCF